MFRFGLLLAATTFLLWGTGFEAEGAEPVRPKRVLLLGQGPDGHPWSTHEYLSGLRMLATVLGRVDGVQTVVVKADGAWIEGPELLDGADAAVLFLAEGAKWMQADRSRLAAFERLAERGGGIAVIHWAMGTREAGPIPAFVALAGGCHGGPDRKYKVVTVTPRVAAKDHPIVAGVESGEVNDEFYYRLKFPKNAENHTPLLTVRIDDEDHPVAWAWQRPDGGRAFGFSGAHSHRNWSHEAYRRLVAQGVLWTAGMVIPEEGIDVRIDDRILVLPPKPITN